MSDRRGLTSVSTKVFYGLGSVAFGVKDNGFQTILLPFYNLVMHVPPQLVGLAHFHRDDLSMRWSIRSWAHFSDHLRTRWGRRHPLMYASALPVAISYLLLWNPPHWSTGALFVYLVIVAIVMRTFITFYEIPSSALVPELTEDYDQRTSFITYRVFFGWYGGMTMLLLAYFVFLQRRCDPQGRPAQRDGLQPLRHRRRHRDVLRDPDFGRGHAPLHSAIPRTAGDAQQLAQYAREMMATLSNRAFLILMLRGDLLQRGDRPRVRAELLRQHLFLEAHNVADFDF